MENRPEKKEVKVSGTGFHTKISSNLTLDQDTPIEKEAIKKSSWFNIFSRKKRKKSTNPIIDFLQSFTLAIVFSLVIFSIFTPSEVEGSSMEPNFFNGERVYTNRLPQWLSDTVLEDVLNLEYERGDVIVFYKPGMSGSLIKRVIGLPGDKIELSNGKFYINDSELFEEYLESYTFTKAGTFLQENSPVIVEENTYFVAGDNRDVSNDSRYIGFIKNEWMQGKVVFRLWPFDRFGFVTQGSYKLL